MEESFYVIFKWMNTELDLDLFERQVYAVIYSYSNNGENTFNSTISYLAGVTGISKRKVKYILDDFVEKGLIGKKDYKVNNVKRCMYYVINVEENRKKWKRKKLCREAAEETIKRIEKEEKEEKKKNK